MWLKIIQAHKEELYILYYHHSYIEYNIVIIIKGLVHFRIKISW